MAARFFNEQRFAEDGSPHQQIGGARRPAEPLTKHERFKP